MHTCDDCRVHSGFSIIVRDYLTPGTLVEVRGYDAAIPPERNDELVRHNSMHRWSVGSLTNERRCFYLGGPLSLLNASCRSHAACFYYFSEAEHHAVLRFYMIPDDELTCCYDGGNAGPSQALKGCGVRLTCLELDCDEVIMDF
jgi:hypothetical protein